MAHRLACGSSVRCAARRGIFSRPAETSWRRLSNARSLTLTPETSSEEKATEEVVHGPIKFSTSKASHKTWKVARMMGGEYQRPWWKVLPISLVGVSLLLWCIFRKETSVDAILQKELYDYLPELLDEVEEEKAEEK